MAILDELKKLIIEHPGLRMPMWKVKLADYLLAVLVAVIYWWDGLWSKCHHFYIVRDGDYVCKYCGNPMVRVAPDSKGVDR